jgi:hypothetical protein
MTMTAKKVTSKKVEMTENGTLICPGCGCSLMTHTRVHVDPGWPCSADEGDGPYIDGACVKIDFLCGGGCERRRYRLFINTIAEKPEPEDTSAVVITTSLAWMIERYE